MSKNTRKKDVPIDFKQITRSMNKIHEAKNKDYGSSFDRSIDKFGLIASTIRMNDKLNRFETLITNKAQVKDESIEDTLIDLANYSIMTVLYLKKTKADENINDMKIYQNPNEQVDFKEVTIKFSPWQKVWIMDDNKVKEVVVVLAEIIDQSLGDKGVRYSIANEELISRIQKNPNAVTLCRVRRQNEVFASKEELLKSL